MPGSPRLLTSQAPTCSRLSRSVNCSFDFALKMSQAIVDGQLSFASRSFERDVDMTGIETSSSVVFDNATVGGFASLVGADIRGQLSLNGLHINGPFKAGAATIAKGFL